MTKKVLSIYHTKTCYKLKILKHMFGHPRRIVSSHLWSTAFRNNNLSLRMEQLENLSHSHKLCIVNSCFEVELKDAGKEKLKFLINHFNLLIYLFIIVPVGG